MCDLCFTITCLPVPVWLALSPLPPPISSWDFFFLWRLEGLSKSSLSVLVTVTVTFPFDILDPFLTAEPKKCLNCQVSGCFSGMYPWVSANRNSTLWPRPSHYLGYITLWKDTDVSYYECTLHCLHPPYFKQTRDSQITLMWRWQSWWLHLHPATLNLVVFSCSRLPVQ